MKVELLQFRDLVQLFNISKINTKQAKKNKILTYKIKDTNRRFELYKTKIKD